MTRPRLPPGARFAPTEEELIKYYLSKKIKGEPFSANFVIERDIYDMSPWKVLGDESLPWQISKVRNKAGSVVGVDRVIYVITKLKNASQNRISRVAGCGVWHGEGGPYKILDGKSATIGTKKTFSFKVVANDDGLEDKTEKVGHWIMHEFSSTTEESNYVICKISRDDSKPLKIAPQKGKKNSSSTKRANNNNVSSTDQDEDDNYALLLEAELEVFNMEEEATHDEDDNVADQYSSEERQTMTEDNEHTQLNNTLGEYSVAQVDNNTLGDEHDEDDQCPNLNQELLLIRGLTNDEFDQQLRLQQQQEYIVAPPCTQVDNNTLGDEHDQDDQCPNLNQDLLLIRGLTNDEFDQQVRLQQEQEYSVAPPCTQVDNNTLGDEHDQDDQCPNLNQDLLLIRGLTNDEFDQQVRLQQEQEYSVAPPCTQVDNNTLGDEHDQDDQCPNLNQDLLLIRGLTNDEFDQQVRLQEEQEYSVAPPCTQVDNNTLGDEHDQDDQCPNLNQDLLLIRGLTNDEFDQQVRLQQEQEYSIAPPCTQVDNYTLGDEHDQNDQCPNLNQDLLLIRGLTNDEFDQQLRLQQEQDHRPPLDWTSNSYFNGNIDQVNEQHHSSHNFDVLHYY